jgi:hypothetical protein
MSGSVLKITAIAFMLLMLLPMVVNATVPYSTYTYSIDGGVLNSPDAYVPQEKIDSISLGLTELMKSPADIDTDREGNVYIVDKTTNRLIVTDPYYKLRFEIKNFVNANGVDDSFYSPESVFVVNYDEKEDANKAKFNGIYVFFKYICRTQ